VAAARFNFRPLTLETWGDLERLFGPRGACGGCWCMWWRLRRVDWEAGRGASNERALKHLVRGGTVPGVLAYAAGEPVGWCACGPRADYGALSRSRILAPVDGREVWSVTCFFVRRDWRGRGLAAGLLRAAAGLAAAAGARVLEGYPHDLPPGALPDPFVHTGRLGSFERAGFREVARRSARRPIVRKTLRRPARKA